MFPTSCAKVTPFADVPLASAFVARWRIGAKVETAGGAFQVREDELAPRIGRGRIGRREGWEISRVAEFSLGWDRGRSAPAPGSCKYRMALVRSGIQCPMVGALAATKDPLTCADGPADGFRGRGAYLQGRL
jgi:hypothetical protein